MYLVGKGSDVMGPGTSMVQRIGWDQAQESQSSGLGCACNKGMGLFDGGMDVSTWGPMEWAAVVVGGYALASTVFATGRGVRAVRAIPGNRRKRKAASLRARANELTKKK